MERSLICSELLSGISMYFGVLGPHDHSYNKENKELRIKGEERK